jgi:type I restriction enzyme M protein
MLGRAYEYLIEKFADDAGKKGGEFYTPNKVVETIVAVLAPREGMRICDPTCGSGGMLIQCAKYIKTHGGNPQNVTLHGQEKNLGTWGICKMNMLLHERPSSRIEKGDTIREPKLVEGGELILYDRVIANPPFSLDQWGREVAEGDRYGRFRFGIPPKGKGDLAFVQHMVATMNAQGKMAVVMPHGVLFRGAAEGTIREGMLREDLFEAVIGLPPNLFYGTGIPAARPWAGSGRCPGQRRRRSRRGEPWSGCRGRSVGRRVARGQRIGRSGAEVYAGVHHGLAQPVSRASTVSSSATLTGLVR